MKKQENIILYKLNKNFISNNYLKLLLFIINMEYINNIENNNSRIIINPEVVFYHIEKCMGSAIEKLLYEYFINLYTDEQIYIPYKNNFKHFCLEQKHFFEQNNFKAILSHISFNQANLTDVFCKSALSIVCVRNPIYRIMSHYYYFDYKNYNKPLYMFNNNEIKSYLNSRKTVLFRLSGNTNDLEIAKENLNKINCILIMEKFDDEIKIFENYLNNKFKVNYTINNNMTNTTNYNIVNYDKNKDIALLLKYSEIISDELELYYYILNMNIQSRFK